MRPFVPLTNARFQVARYSGAQASQDAKCASWNDRSSTARASAGAPRTRRPAESWLAGMARAAARRGGNGETIAAGAGAKAGFGLRKGAAAGRGGSGDIRERSAGRVSEDRTSEVLASEALAKSRDICCAIWSWPALSCAMLALSCSICCPMAVRSRVIDCNCAVSGETAAGAAAAADAGATGGAAGAAGACVGADACAAA